MTGKALLDSLTAIGVRLIPVNGFLEIEADEEVLADDLLARIRTHKVELLALLTPKPCKRCSTPMTKIEAGYFSCPACFFQLVEAKSGFWVTGIAEMKEAA